MNKEISYKGELFRKTIHLSSSIFTYFLYLFGKEKIIFPLIIITFLYITFDYVRRFNKINNLYLKYFKTITRDNEYKKNLTGASYVLLGITLTIIFFEPHIAIPSILIMSLADSFSAIIGRKFNYTKLNNKTLEGSFAFYITSSIILSLFNVSIFYSLFIGLCLTIVEFLDKIIIDDNLSLPIISSILIKILTT